MIGRFDKLVSQVKTPAHPVALFPLLPITPCLTLPSLSYPHQQGALPERYWDPVTKWKFDNLLGVFRRNMYMDAEILKIDISKEATEMAVGTTMPVAEDGKGSITVGINRY